MDFETYRESIAQDAPPPELGMALQALWWEAKGDWHQAHKSAQQQGDAEGAWAHAYLHRVEGDMRNAGGWYGRAGRPMPTAPLKEEWETIARALLG
ncbi:MAG: hypothetical protein WA417_07290 [Stellaceae bacterium]|jgi:hypothetical protein